MFSFGSKLPAVAVVSSSFYSYISHFVFEFIHIGFIRWRIAKLNPWCINYSKHVFLLPSLSAKGFALLTRVFLSVFVNLLRSLNSSPVGVSADLPWPGLTLEKCVIEKSKRLANKVRICFFFCCCFTCPHPVQHLSIHPSIQRSFIYLCFLFDLHLQFICFLLQIIGVFFLRCWLPKA